MLVERDLLVHGWRKALGQPTMNLPLNHHGVDNRPTVIDGHKAANMYLACATVDIHNTDVAAKGVGEIGRIIVVYRFQTWLQVGRAVGIGGKGQLLYGFPFSGRAFDKETPWLP